MADTPFWRGLDGGYRGGGYGGLWRGFDGAKRGGVKTRNPPDVGGLSLGYLTISL